MTASVVLNDNGVSFCGLANLYALRTYGATDNAAMIAPYLLLKQAAKSAEMVILGA